MKSASAVELRAARVTLEHAVRSAGALQRKGWASLKVAVKGEGDIVTDVDRACEAAAVGIIQAAHPTHAILAEEGTGTRTEEGPLWILDPLDGTKNYVHGSMRFACSLALRWDGVLLLGAVYNPSHEELFVAQHGAGATLNGSPIRVSATQDLDQALVATALTVRRRFSAQHLERVRELAGSAQGVRVGGCASLDLCDVACGRLDAYLEEGLDPWDTAAGALIVVEAGGTVTNFQGEQHDLFGPETLASNGAVGAALVGRWRGVAGPE